MIEEESDDGAILDALMAGLGDVMAWVTSPDGKIVACNDKAAEVLGYSTPEMKGMGLVTDVMPEGEQPGGQGMLDEAVKGEKTEQAPCMMEKKGSEDGKGQAIPVVLDVNPMSAPRGGVALWMGKPTVDDGSGGLKIDTDPEGNVVAASPKACEKLAYDGEDEVLGKAAVGELVSADDKEKMEKALADALQGIPTLSVPVVLVGKNGEEVPLVVDVSAKLNDAEEVVGVVIEEESDDGAILDALMAGLGDVMAWVTNPDGEIVACSKRAAKELQYSKSDMMGKGLVSELIQEASREKAQEGLDSISSGDSTENMPCVLYNKAQEDVPLTMHVTPLASSPRGGVALWIGRPQEKITPKWLLAGALMTTLQLMPDPEEYMWLWFNQWYVWARNEGKERALGAANIQVTRLHFQ